MSDDTLEVTRKEMGEFDGDSCVVEDGESRLSRVRCVLQAIYIVTHHVSPGDLEYGGKTFLSRHSVYDAIS
jgi:hypothetical protein